MRYDQRWTRTRPTSAVYTAARRSTPPRAETATRATGDPADGPTAPQPGPCRMAARPYPTPGFRSGLRRMVGGR